VQPHTTIQDVATGQRFAAGSLPELFASSAPSAYYRPAPPPPRAFVGDVVVGAISAILAGFLVLLFPLGLAGIYFTGSGLPHENATILEGILAFFLAVVPWLIASIGMIRSRQWSFVLGLAAAAVSMVITLGFWNASTDPNDPMPQFTMAFSIVEIVMTLLFAFYCVLRLTGAVGPRGRPA
jgi:hypothetical protein